MNNVVGRVSGGATEPTTGEGEDVVGGVGGGGIKMRNGNMPAKQKKWAHCFLMFRNGVKFCMTVPFSPSSPVKCGLRR